MYGRRDGLWSIRESFFLPNRCHSFPIKVQTERHNSAFSVKLVEWTVCPGVLINRAVEPVYHDKGIYVRCNLLG